MLRLDPIRLDRFTRRRDVVFSLWRNPVQKWLGSVTCAIRDPEPDTDGFERPFIQHMHSGVSDTDLYMHLSIL